MMDPAEFLGSLPHGMWPDPRDGWRPDHQVWQCETEECGYAA